MKVFNLFCCLCCTFLANNVQAAVSNVDSSRSTVRRVTQTTNTNTQKNRQINTNRSVKNTNSRNTVNRLQAKNVADTKNILLRQSQNTNTSINQNRSAINTKKTNILSRSATTNTNNISRKNSIFNNSRSATNNSKQNILSRDFSKCRNTFYECMDEFCNNKDSQLKRCACSARSSDFDKIKKQLNSVDDKLLDFSQRLLTVSMSPEDTAVINTPTIGELTYQQTNDSSASKKALDSIAEKLNANFNSANSQISNALTWSLNTDSAFDSIDSTSGTATTLKSGTALYSAALPICQEMAQEVCDSTDLSLAQSGYLMTIEQDCNTVAKTYETQTAQAQTKILESSALLDMSRLNVYQTNNSDDMITCKSKMLEILYNTSVCGENLNKCLDITGRYIDPTTGDAILTKDLGNLTTLLTRPTNGEKWAKISYNTNFINYLTSKKKYLESATQNCQEIADDVWNDFLEDALAQIKLAQDSKIQEIRQGCTTLLSECISETKDSITDFDSRALSIFGVTTDKTVNSLCSDVNIACNTIMQYDINSDWANGIQEIKADTTYDTILKTCNEIGRNCIIQTCSATSGNFGLCENTDSVYRHAILDKSACWQEVLNCVSEADDIDQIITNLTNNSIYVNTPPTFYSYLYENQQAPTDSICSLYSYDSIDYKKCILAEMIWGNCQNTPSEDANNTILIPNNNKSTLLSWFATNTDNYECSINSCPIGQHTYLSGNGTTLCANNNAIIQCSGQSLYCPSSINPTTSYQNCCPFGLFDDKGNCCTDATINVNNPFELTNPPQRICVPSGISVANLVAKNNSQYLICLGSLSSNTTNTVNCDGDYITIEQNNYIYKSPTANNYSALYLPNNYYILLNYTNFTVDQNPNTTDGYCSPIPANLCKYMGPNNWKKGDNSQSCSAPSKHLIKFYTNQ